MSLSVFWYLSKSFNASLFIISLLAAFTSGVNPASLGSFDHFIGFLIFDNPPMPLLISPPAAPVAIPVRTETPAFNQSLPVNEDYCLK